MYILEFLLENKNTSYKYFEKVFWCKFKIQNVLISYTIKQIGKLRHDDAYIQEKEDYKTYKTVKDSGLDKDKITSAMNERIIYYGLTKDDFEQYVKVQQDKYRKYASSQMAQIIAKDVFSAVKKCLYSNGKEIHHKKPGNIHTVSAKSLNNGILLDTEHEACHSGSKKKGMDCHFILVINGEPVHKHTCGEGECGIDPGVSTVAAVSNDKCFLEVLASGAEKYNKDIVECQKAMERSRRVNNPECYNKDRTVKKGSRFKKTKKYKKLLRRFRTLHRKAGNLQYLRFAPHG